MFYHWNRVSKSRTVFTIGDPRVDFFETRSHVDRFQLFFTKLCYKILLIVLHFCEAQLYFHARSTNCASHGSTPLLHFWGSIIVLVREKHNFASRRSTKKQRNKRVEKTVIKENPETRKETISTGSVQCMTCDDAGTCHMACWAAHALGEVPPIDFFFRGSCSQYMCACISASHL